MQGINKASTALLQPSFETPNFIDICILTHTCKPNLSNLSSRVKRPEIHQMKFSNQSQSLRPNLSHAVDQRSEI